MIYNENIKLKEEVMKTIENAKIISKEFISENICDMVIECSHITREAKAGQFVELYPDNGINLLPRPISICGINKIQGTVRLVFQIVGKGTELFSRLREGDSIRVLGPCGNGYDIIDDVDGRALLVGGGIGIPPLLEACRQLNCTKIAVLGYRTGSFLADEFREAGAKVYITTDDGSLGFKGNVVDLLKAEDISADIIYSCGPRIMLKYLSAWAEEKNISCCVSMEERMACGIGACVGCVLPVKENDKIVYKKVCKDGPVFDSREVCW